jgi:hypothetical protein
MTETQAIKVASVVLYTSLGYTTYRASRGIAWVADKVEHRWKTRKAPDLKVDRSK